MDGIPVDIGVINKKIWILRIIRVEGQPQQALLTAACGYFLPDIQENGLPCGVPIHLPDEPALLDNIDPAGSIAGTG